MNLEIGRGKRIGRLFMDSFAQAFLITMLFGLERKHIVPSVILMLCLFGIKLNKDPILN